SAAARTADNSSDFLFMFLDLGKENPQRMLRGGGIICEAGRDLQGRFPGSRPSYCCGILASRAILRKVPICSRTNFANASVLMGTGAMPILPNCSRTCYLCTTVLTCAFSFWTTAPGVPARAHMPNHSARS